ncbi:hypothetical protein OHC33_009243 [Knufia fluminis]|uniref:Uncharacterized protein n=1 Tax=Knufia fluminis TaxID=191047 RepID=A0AAN8F1M2_9EURO|nr:hypothetical protein OHC33_009243 [Knufia fluminis]
MDIDDSASDTSSVEAHALQLAAHPLSSVNPPPPDLPDLLDKLIASDAELRKKWTVCDQIVTKLLKRVPNIKQKLEGLRQAHPHYRTDVARSKPGRRTKQRKCFEACEQLYQRMFMQTSFMHYCLTRKTKPLLQQHMKAHKDIFDALLGGRHDHRGIELANSRRLQCAPACNWYAEHGPYEWTMQPYTNQWWEAMNNTQWDWVRMRQHIADTMTNAQTKGIVVADIFLSNAQKYVPFWFWYEKYESWFPRVDIIRIQNENDVEEEKFVCKVLFEKTEAIMEKERLWKIEQLRQVRSEQEEANEESATTDAHVEVDPLGERDLDLAVVFDGNAYSPDFNNGAQPTSMGSWLNWWGFEKWLKSHDNTTQQAEDSLRRNSTQARATAQQTECG